MQDELERTAESPALSSVRPNMRFELLDAPAAAARAEAVAKSRVFGDPKSELSAPLEEARAATERGERAVVFARASSIGAARSAMRAIAEARVPVVVHASAALGQQEIGAALDLGWGVLYAAGPEDSFDLALVARRAAEDAAVPFLVVHAHAGSEGGARPLAYVAMPSDGVAAAFVGEARRREGTGSRDDAAQRLPFALGSALREYVDVGGRRYDLFERAPLGEAPLVLVGMGPIGGAIATASSELRARGYDVAAVHVAAVRPFPGAKLVKALSRALAVTVLEPTTDPLGHGGLLARELKAAFTDALTWVPGYPGIGRVPKLFEGVTGPSVSVLDLAAACDNMLEADRGKRVFSFVSESSALPRAKEPEGPEASSSIAVRLVLDDVASAERVLAVAAAVFAGGLGLRASGTIATRGDLAIVDVVAAPSLPRGALRAPARLVVATERGAASAEAALSVSPGALLAVLGGSGAASIPEAARALLQERRARTGGVALSTSAELAATCAGVVLAPGASLPRARLDGAAVARVVAEHFGAEGEAAGAAARRAFESAVAALGSS